MCLSLQGSEHMEMLLMIQLMAEAHKRSLNTDVLFGTMKKVGLDAEDVQARQMLFPFLRAKGPSGVQRLA